MAFGHIHIGTSGWHYDHWRGPFYPPEMAAADFLEFYIRRFHTVEVNNTFYQLPEKKTLHTWAETVPKSFIFTVKASRYITHMKKLKDPKKSVAKFFRRVEVFGPRLGPVLFQLPPRWKVNPERLSAFLEQLPPEHRYAFEFRDDSWFDDRIYRILLEHEAAWCIYHLAGRLSPKEVTANFSYIRLHGPGRAYQGQYDGRTLSGWAGAISAWSRAGKDVYCYFDNDQNGYAAQDAGRLQEMLSSG
jgi:uncharacterized protein YecE (DUF72 family)